MPRGGGGIGDDALNLKYGYDRVWFPNNAQGIILATGTGYGAGPSVEGELSVAASELNAMPMDAADEIYFMLNPRKWDCDYTRDLQVLVGAESAAAGSAIWQLDIKGVAAGAAFTDAKVTPDGTVTFASKTYGVDTLEETPFVPLNVPNVFAADSVIMCAITLVSIVTITANQLRLMYVDIKYSVGLTDENGPYRT
jgi:hypothetical protein